MNKIKIKTPLGHEIVATSFLPENPNGKALIISAATGVPQRFYANFAQYMSEKGFVCYTYDYEGMGESRHGDIKNCKANYTTWAENDFESVFNHVQKEHTGKKIFLLGHSFGGNGIATSRKVLEAEGIVTVASQMGYYKYYDRQLTLQFLFRFAMPFLTKILGYFPSKWFGIGEALPSGVAKDWCVYILHRDSVLELSRRRNGFAHHDVTCKMLIINISDDWMAPKMAVDKLAELAYKNAQKQRLTITPADANVTTIGHLDFFRKKHKETLWVKIEEWLEK